jgi:hypothetical protein
VKSDLWQPEDPPLNRMYTVGEGGLEPRFQASHRMFVRGEECP